MLKTCLAGSLPRKKSISHQSLGVLPSETLLLLILHVLAQAGGWCSYPDIRAQTCQDLLRWGITGWFFPKIPPALSFLPLNTPESFTDGVRIEIILTWITYKKSSVEVEWVKNLSLLSWVKWACHVSLTQPRTPSCGQLGVFEAALTRSGVQKFLSFGGRHQFLVADAQMTLFSLCSEDLHVPLTPGPQQEHTALTWWAPPFPSTSCKGIWIPSGPAPSHFHTRWMTRPLRHSSKPSQTFPPEQQG